MSPRRLWGNLLALALGLVLAAVLLETALRFLPVNEVLGSLPVDDDNPVLRYIPDRTLTWSRDGSMDLANTVHINNYGFVNDQDYVPDADTPLVAVIGDSYVEALMVPYDNTLHGRLAVRLEGSARVYSFARSGAPLSQYLAYARWARDEFHPQRFVFVVVGNDFDESLLRYKSAAGFHYFCEDQDGLALTRRDYEPGPAARLAPHSRLLLYLLLNLRVTLLPHTLAQALNAGGDGAAYQGNTRAEADAERTALALAALDAFLDRLPEATGVPREDVLLVMDGYRHLLEAGEPAPESGFFHDMREALLERAAAAGFRVLDMQPVFAQDFQVRSIPFSYPMDGHWNGHAHGLAARAVVQSGFLNGLADQEQ